MAKIKDLLGDSTAFAVDASSFGALNPQSIWADYDAETDSLMVFFAGKPVAGVNVQWQDGIYAVIDADRRVVGLHIEAWEKHIVPSQPDLAAAWEQIRAASGDAARQVLMRFLAYWLVMSYRYAAGPQSHLQPAS